MSNYKDLISIAQLFLKNRSYGNKTPTTSDFGGESLRLEIYFAGEIPVEKVFFKLKKRKDVVSLFTFELCRLTLDEMRE